MSRKIYIQLCRYGDVMNILPLAWDDAQKGQRSGIVVAKEFADILDGCSYVDKIEFNGNPWELERAVKEAEAMGGEVLNCQLVGPYEAVRNVVVTRNGIEYRTTSESFLKDQWKLAGRLDDWKRQLPLVFDRRDAEREKALAEKHLPKKKKTILVAGSGVSSPFQYTKLLYEVLRFKYGRYYNIVDIAAIRADRIYDLLGLFDHERTALLVSIDSAALHLAYASPRLPVVALTADHPSLWHGSVWRPNHIFHCRYSQFPQSVQEMVDAIDRTGSPGYGLNDALKPSIVHVWSGYENGRDDKAWEAEYKTYRWIATPMYPGSVGRDSTTQLKCSKRFPFLRDVIRIGTLRAQADDFICVSRADTVPLQPLTDLILNSEKPMFFRRSENGYHHPAVDMFCFRKSWWQANQKDLPDLVFGKDFIWHRVFSEFLKGKGAVEIQFAITKNKNGKPD